MDLVFNELSIEPLAEDKTKAFERVDLFLSTFVRARKYRFNVIRLNEYFGNIKLLEDYTFEDFCNEPTNKTKNILLRGLFKYPFIEDNSEEEDKFIQNNFYLIKNETEVETYGLASAYLYSTIGIGFCPDEFWNKCKHKLSIIGETEYMAEVFCCSKPDHFDDIELQEFIDSRLPLELIETGVIPADKPIELRDDHGKDTLEEFAKKIRKSPYIVSIVNSLPYNSSCINFVKKSYSNGLIELVLTNTDKGLGLVVKTTGRNLRETNAIAKIIEDEYKP